MWGVSTVATQTAISRRSTTEIRGEIMKQYAQYLRKSRAEEGMELEEVLAKHRRALAELAEKQHIVIADTYEEIVSGESIALRRFIFS